MLKAGCSAFNILISNDINIFSYFRQSTAYEDHNLKVVGSNPTPATKYYNKIKYLESESNTRVLQARIHINATSTFDEAVGKTARNQRCRILI